MNINSIKDRPKVLLVTRCLVTDDQGNILLIKRSKEKGWAAGKWEFPGGKLDVGTDALHSMVREVLEETALLINLESPLVYFDSFVTSGGKYQGLPYILLTGKGKVIGGAVKLSSEHIDYAWVPSKEAALLYDLTEEVRKALTVL